MPRSLFERILFCSLIIKKKLFRFLGTVVSQKQPSNERSLTEANLRDHQRESKANSKGVKVSFARGASPDHQRPVVVPAQQTEIKTTTRSKQAKKIEVS